MTTRDALFKEANRQLLKLSAFVIMTDTEVYT